MIISHILERAHAGDFASDFASEQSQNKPKTLNERKKSPTRAVRRLSVTI